MVLLKDIVVILALALFVAGLLRRIGFPLIAGFIMTGILAGPYALGLVSAHHEIKLLAEIGVTLLLFEIGLELSLGKLKRLWKVIVLGGSLQVGLTIGVTAAVAKAFNYPFSQALFLGFLVAISSTAIVLRGLESRGELPTPHGRVALGILLFQDLSVVPMMLAIPLLARNGEVSPENPWLFFGRSMGLLLVIFFAGKWMVPRFLSLMAKTRQRELFVLSVLVSCMATALFASHLASISLPLGAFVAGLIVSNTNFRDQALTEVIPFRYVFVSLFFISIGMLLDVEVVLQRPYEVLLVTLALIGGKFLLVLMVGLLLRFPLVIATHSALALSQVGEFAFVLVDASRAYPTMEGIASPVFLAAVIISMLLTPLLLRIAPNVAAGTQRLGWLDRMLRVREARECAEPGHELYEHVVIAGFGWAGERLARALQERKHPFVVVDLSLENVRKGMEEKFPIYFGDVSSFEVLKHLQVEKAALLVIAINHTRSSLLAVRRARTLASELPIIVRAQYEMDQSSMTQAGANDIVIAENIAAEHLEELVLSKCDFSKKA